MKAQQIAILALIAIATIGLYNLSINGEPQEQTMFNVWMEKHGKQYESLGEKSYRLGIWLDNLKFVKEYST